MLRLLESGALPSHRGTAWAAASAVMHGSIIILAATTGAREVVARAEPVPVDRIVFTTLPKPGTASARPGGAPVPIVGSRPPIDLSYVRLPQFAAPVSVELPDHDAMLPGATVGTGLPDSGLAPGHPGAGNRVFEARAVDRAVAPSPGNGAPDYPAMLRAAAIEGQVLVRFIVDADGRVERSSIEIVRSTHTLFAESVRRWLPATRYAAAEYAGARVRQRVEQRVEFRLQ